MHDTRCRKIARFLTFVRNDILPEYQKVEATGRLPLRVFVLPTTGYLLDPLPDLTLPQAMQIAVGARGGNFTLHVKGRFRLSSGL